MKFNLNLKEILKSAKTISYTTLVIAMIVSNLFSAVITILPTDVVGFGSTKVSFLGYVTHCSFAPWSTLISLVLVGLGIYFLIRLIKYLKLNSITFAKLLKIHVIAAIIIFLVSVCLPFVLFVVGAYILIKLVMYLKPRFEQKWIEKTEAKN